MKSTDDKLIYSTESYALIGACFEVYNEKGSGFLEAVYQECLELEFGLQGIPFVSQQRIALTYKGRPLATNYIADAVCYNKILVELKAVSNITDEHRAQLLNYLHATGLDLGFLINFGHHPKLQWERMIR